ncbi:MAG: 50S ribosomal protein L6 [Myxococcota bacterium]|nr:50S ribosomal protein L6 [Myxococcota bacterium]
MSLNSSSVPAKFKNSRIGKKPIVIPQKVEVTLSNDGKHIKVKGPKGELQRTILDSVNVRKDGDTILVEQNLEKGTFARSSRAFHGLTRTLISNMIIGVDKGFSKQLEIIGVGYKADVKGKKLVLNLGYSHLINYPFPEGIKIEAKTGPQSTIVTVMGSDKEKVGQTAAEIRKFRKPDAYKGKGVRYVGETIRLKDGKK